MKFEERDYVEVILDAGFTDAPVNKGDRGVILELCRTRAIINKAWYHVQMDGQKYGYWCIPEDGLESVIAY